MSIGNEVQHFEAPNNPLELVAHPKHNILSIRNRPLKSEADNRRKTDASEEDKQNEDADEWGRRQKKDKSIGGEDSRKKIHLWAGRTAEQGYTYEWRGGRIKTQLVWAECLGAGRFGR
jgi:hypothetical protein